MSLTDFKARMNKSKINKYKINNNNKTNTKHEFNVKYERYKQDISKNTLQMQKKSEKPPHFSENMSPCHAFTSPSCSLREKSSLPIFCKCGELCNIQIILLYLIDIRVCD
jgi:hypothetical protein